MKLKTVTNIRCEPSSKNVTKDHMKKTSVATPYPASDLMQTILLNHYGKKKKDS